MFRVLLSYIGLLCASSAVLSSDSIKKFAVYYGNQIDSKSLSEYQLVVFDRYHHPRLQTLQESGVVVLGYLSVGEIAAHDYFYDQAKRKGWLGQENSSWPGRYVVDLRNLAWQKYIIEHQIPQLLKDGFDGVFIDTLDSALQLAAQDEEKYKGMQAAALDLIKAIRTHYPKIRIMQNRGYEILPISASLVDYILAESFLSLYDFGNKTYRKTSDQDYQWTLQQLRKIQSAYPKVQIFTLDYWDVGDRRMISEIYHQQREAGFIPYVATLELDRLVSE